MDCYEESRGQRAENKGGIKGQSITGKMSEPLVGPEATSRGPAVCFTYLSYSLFFFRHPSRPVGGNLAPQLEKVKRVHSIPGRSRPG